MVLGGQDAPKTEQDGAKTRQDGAKTAQDGAKTGQGGIKTPQDAAKTLQDGAETVQERQITKNIEKPKEKHRKSRFSVPPLSRENRPQSLGYVSSRYLILQLSEGNLVQLQDA